ncbi:hypothetical protein BOX15_Mlig029173g1 [Macrostomum lignano]|uniref:G-protein coupled receptors family 1 profile domain-containing protein n=1 Tax=Macrostomum lignano TaxID=282301 RepID=A0A267FH28_9PLAT|nr:hypothetical protein BOX15_Mlig029173g3 [Macrostomum lignano]PAA61128.1 hypothetical protein BOX15_Mlig029173g2 [Macrostomum lignano]PAA73071.1 hypothetical protein BOX15_Mlig029173g1 [Macrostomum lignano]
MQVCLIACKIASFQLTHLSVYCLNFCTDHFSPESTGTAVCGVFLLCWLPFFISNLMWAACLKNIDEELFKSPLCSYDRRISVFIVWLGYVNSTLNPLIYTIFNNEFRKAFKKLLHIT